MREPRFWRRRNILAHLLAPIAAVYGAVATRRMARPGQRAGIPVICIGDFTAGGAGKTPTAIAVAKLMLASGQRPVFVSRGYGGALAGPVRVASGHRARDVGDEPLLLARTAPTIMARNRFAGALAAAAAGASVIVLDDGLQNSALMKDFSLVVVEGERGIGNGLVIPAGPLRAPLAAQLERAAAVLVIGHPSAASRAVTARAQAHGRPILRASIVPDPAAVAALAGKRVLAFAGIANPQKFFATLAATGVSTPVTRAFPDHHRYTQGEAAALLAEAMQQDLILLCTEKDLARMHGEPDLAALADATATLPISVRFEDAELVRRMVLAAVQP